MALNYLAALKGKSFDKDGSMARSGSVNNKLLARLNGLGYYQKRKSKSLGREWFTEVFLPLVETSPVSIEDKLATVTEHIAFQIAKVIARPGKKARVLVTGGGANNRFLITLLREKLRVHEIYVPSKEVVDFKEALVFAFLGVLKAEQKVNTLYTATGATKDSSGGVVFIP